MQDFEFLAAEVSEQASLQHCRLGVVRMKFHSECLASALDLDYISYSDGLVLRCLWACSSCGWCGSHVREPHSHAQLWSAASQPPAVAAGWIEV